MTRTHLTSATPAGRSLRALVTSALLAAALPVTAAVLAPAAASATPGAEQDGAQQVFYTTSGAGAPG